MKSQKFFMFFSSGVSARSVLQGWSKDQFYAAVVHVNEYFASRHIPLSLSVVSIATGIEISLVCANPQHRVRTVMEVLSTVLVERFGWMQSECVNNSFFNLFRVKNSLLEAI